MRSLPPSETRPDTDPYKAEPVTELIFNVTAPLGLFREEFFVSLVVGRHFTRTAGLKDLPLRKRLFNIAVISSLALIVMMTVLGSTTFLVYLFKMFLGIDFMPDEHLFGP